MRQALLFSAIAFSTLLVTAGCKVVKNVDPNSESEMEAALTDA
jgi:hypothetical protein